MSKSSRSGAGRRPVGGGARNQIQLTGRQQQIVDLLIKGCANREIASELGVSEQTIKNQLTTLYQKARVGGRVELVSFALRQRLGRRS